MEINLTPDFIRYIENGSEGKVARSKTNDQKLFDKLNSMNDKELMDYFTKDMTK